MSTSAQNRGAPTPQAPKSHQITTVNITTKTGMQVAVYSIHSKTEILESYEQGDAFLRITTGDDSDTVLIMPTDEIVILAVANVSHITRLT